MSMSSVISGEAAETDSDGEHSSPGLIHPHSTKNISNEHTMKGAIITGEDSESDTEITLDSIRNSENLVTKDEIKDKSPVRVKKNYDSLLHRKLNENNMNLYRNMKGFLSTQVNTASTSLNNSDRDLMKSQNTLQGALNYLRLLNAHSETIKYILKNVVVEDNYLHNLVTIKK